MLLLHDIDETFVYELESKEILLLPKMPKIKKQFFFKNNHSSKKQEQRSLCQKIEEYEKEHMYIHNICKGNLKRKENINKRMKKIGPAQ